MKVSISKSVGRAFEVMELFRESRTPASATEIRRRLGCPHSSVVAVLHNLVELGYLSYDPKSRAYFPTLKLSTLGTWVRPALKGASQLGKLAEAIVNDTGHTTAISCRNSFFLNIVFARRGGHPQAAQVSCGIGVSLARSIPGLVILSQMGDQEIAATIAKANLWAEKAHAEQSSHLEEVMKAVGEIRATGCRSGFDWSFPGVGAIAYPVVSPFDETKVVISVTGPTKLVKPKLALIRQTMEHYLALHASGAPQPWPRFVAPVESEKSSFRLRRPSAQFESYAYRH